MRQVVERTKTERESAREKGRQGLLFLALRGPAAAAFIIQMLQHDTELIQPWGNTAARGPVLLTFTRLVLPTQTESDDLLRKGEIGGHNNSIRLAH